MFASIADFSETDCTHPCVGRTVWFGGIERAMAEGIYHERQSKELCALHALNNIFQRPNEFTQVMLAWAKFLLAFCLNVKRIFLVFPIFPCTCTIV
jgi:hypothetical protein